MNNKSGRSVPLGCGSGVLTSTGKACQRSGPRTMLLGSKRLFGKPPHEVSASGAGRQRLSNSCAIAIYGCRGELCHPQRPRSERESRDFPVRLAGDLLRQFAAVPAISTPIWRCLRRRSAEGLRCAKKGATAGGAGTWAARWLAPVSLTIPRNPSLASRRRKYFGARALPQPSLLLADSSLLRTTQLTGVAPLVPLRASADCSKWLAHRT
jgi:hypothetical protein